MKMSTCVAGKPPSCSPKSRGGWAACPPIHGLQSESWGLPLSLTSRGRQSDREFGREITHQGDCLLRRASNQLRNNNCVTKINSAFAAGHQAGVAPSSTGQLSRGHGPSRSSEGLAAALGPSPPPNPIPSALPYSAPRLPQRWDRALAHPPAADLVLSREQSPPTVG